MATKRIDVRNRKEFSKGWKDKPFEFMTDAEIDAFVSSVNFGINKIMYGSNSKIVRDLRKKYKLEGLKTGERGH